MTFLKRKGDEEMGKMKYWRREVKRLKGKREMMNLEYQKEKKILLDKIISSITDELFIIYEELLRDYGFKRYDPDFSGSELRDFGRGEEYEFYLWKIELNVDSIDKDNFIFLILCGDRNYELPDSFELESADNHNPNFKQTYHKGISPRGLRFIFEKQLAKMGFQKKKKVKRIKSFGIGIGV